MGMLKGNKISISNFSPDQRYIVYKLLVFQKFCPGKFLIQEPWPFDELNEDEVGTLKDRLREFMPLDTIVTDLWDWDIRFEDKTFNDSYFDVALGAEQYAIEQAKLLKDDFLEWIDECQMDYDQHRWENQEEFEDWIHSECVRFIKIWRSNIAKELIKL